jgi:nucleotide-binding universal stress UspA family protein
MLSCGRPTLIVPYIGPRATFGERVLVAWDGRREASRALGDALPLLKRAGAVVIMTVSPDVDRPTLNDIAQQRLAHYLRAHRVEAQMEKFDVRDRDVAAWLLSRAADLGIDLMVMGGYGHSRLQETVLGGVTRSILQAMTVPVLMAH